MAYPRDPFVVQLVHCNTILNMQIFKKHHAAINLVPTPKCFIFLMSIN